MSQEIALRPDRRFLPRDLSEELALWGPYIATTAIYIATVALVSHGNGLGVHLRLTSYHTVMQLSTVATAFLAVIGYIAFLAFGERESRPLRRMGRDIAAHILPPHCLAGLLIPLISIPFIVGAFSSFKAMIPILNPFHLNPLFEKIDRLLHFGVAPWEITHFLFRGEALNLLLQIAYNSWFALMWVFMFGHICWLKNRSGRVRYLLAFILCWIVIGSLFAFLLSSAGPCFYGRVYEGVDPYAPLMAQLHAIHQPMVESGQHWSIWSLWVQDALWYNYTHNLQMLGSGISAMPSMHVSMAVLMALGAFRFSKLIGRIMTVYAVLILIGSVHLGWHYAIDGYLAAALTVLIWHFSGRAVARMEHGRNALLQSQAL